MTRQLWQEFLLWGGGWGVEEVEEVGARQGAEAARRRRKRDVSSENITHRIEPWQSEGLSEMVPHGTETGGGERSGTPCQLDLKRNRERERSTRER